MFSDSKIGGKYSQNERKISMWSSMVSVCYFKTYWKAILKANPFHSSLMRPQLPKPKKVRRLCSVLERTFWCYNHGLLSIGKTSGTFLWICTESWLRYQFYAPPLNGWTKCQQKVSAFINGLLIPWKNNLSWCWYLSPLYFTQRVQERR